MSEILVDQFSGVLPDNGILVKIYCKEMQKGTEKRLEIQSALKLQELVKEAIELDGRALVDIQNWLSKRAKKLTEFEYKILQSLVEESERITSGGKS